MAFIVIADPYWLISKRTLRADSPALDTQMRTAKALQLVFREKEVPLKVILLGSSTVYRGLNPSVLDYAPGEVYNLGISSLRMLEAKSYVRHFLLFSQPEVVVIGLDFFQFDGNKQVEAGFDSTLGNSAALPEIYLTSIVSRDALESALRVYMSKPDGDGAWSRDGYKKTSPRSAGDIRAQLESARSFYGKVDTRSRRPYEYLEQIIAMLKQRNVAVMLYLSPLHPGYEAAIRAAGKGDELDEWRQRVRGIAAARGVKLFELNQAKVFSSAGFDGVSGFNDPSHFSEWVGTMLMDKMGLPIKGDSHPSDGKRP